MRAGILALAVAVAGPASAAELFRSGPWLLEGQTFFKPYVSWLRLAPSLVEGVAALDAAIEEARVLQPGLPFPSVALPDSVGLTTATWRVGGSVSHGEAWTFEAAWQASFIVASDPAFAGAGGSNYLGASLFTAQRRLVDFAPFLVDGGAVRLQHNLDRLAVTYRGKGFSVVVGRQVVSWGTGRLWNPTDLVAPFAPTDVDREVRRGTDAVRVSISLGPTSGLDLLYFPQTVAGENGGVIRARTNLSGWDFSATVGKYGRDLVLGGDFSGDIGVLGAHGEAAWTLPLVGLDGARPVAVEGDFGRAVVGVDWRPAEPLVLTLEYYFNGFGAARPEEILRVLRSERVVRGEVFGASRHYLGLVASVLASDVLTLGFSTIVNLMDPSVLFVPSVEWSFEQRVLLRAGGFVPVGAGIDVSVLRLGGADVVGNTAAWQHAQATFGARSEYGLSAYGAFVQVGLYLN